MTPNKQPLWSRSVAAALATSMGIDPCGSAAAEHESVIDEARHSRDKGDLRAALLRLTSLVRITDSPQARHLLGELYLDQGDLEAAKEQFRRAEEAGSEDALTALQLAKTLLMQGHFELMLWDIKTDVAPAYRPAMLSMRANALIGLGNMEQASALLAEALSLNPESPEALLGLTRIALWKQQPRSASAFLARALASNPGDIDSLRFQADLLRAHGKIEPALAAQKAALERRPCHTGLLIGLAELYIDAGHVEAARATLAAARRSAGSGTPVLYTEALLHLHESKLAQATEVAERLLRSDSTHTPAMLLTGALYLAGNELSLAEQQLQRFLRVFPGHLFALCLMASRHLKAHHPEAAIALLAPLLAGEPAAAVLTLAGQANLLAGHYSAAAELLGRAAVVPPSAGLALDGLAHGRMGEADDKRAIVQLERAILRARLDGTMPHPAQLIVRALSHLHDGAPEQAQALLDTLDNGQANPLTHQLHGEVAMQQHNARLARASFSQALAIDAAFAPALLALERLDTAERKPLDQTRNRYLAALAAAPGASAIMDALARIALDHGHTAEALGWSERAAKENPSSLVLALKNAELLLQVGERDKALACCLALQRSHPADPQVLSLLGRAWLAAGDFGNAIAVLAELAAQQPASGMPHVHLATVHIARQHDAEALASLRTALALEPELIAASSGLAALLTRHGRFPEAVNVALALQRRLPDSAAGYQMEGEVHTAQSHHAAAALAYERAVSLQPNGPHLMRFHAALVKSGRHADAARTMRAWLEQHPDDLPTRLYFARSLLAAQQLDAATTHLERVLEQAPDHLEALNDLAWTCQRKGDEKALALAQRAHALAPDNPAVMDTLGWIQLEQGELMRAMPLLQKAATLAPHAAEIQFHYGTLLARAGDQPGARRALEKSLASATPFPGRDQARMLLARL